MADSAGRGLSLWPRTGPVGWLAAGLMAATALLYGAAAVLALGGPAGVRPDGAGAWVADDYVAYLTGAELLRRGDVRGLYDRAAQMAVQATLVARPIGSLNEYVNPPLWGVLMMGLLPLGTAGAGVALKGLTIAGLPALLRRRADRATLLAALPLVGFAPYVIGWTFGSMVVVPLAALAGWLSLLRVGRPRLAGAALSLLLLKPQYAPLPLAYLVWKRQWPQVGGFALGAAVQALLNLGVLAATGQVPLLADLGPYLSPDGAGTKAGIALHVSLRAALLGAAPDLPLLVFLLVLGLLTVAAGGAFLASVGREWRGSDERALAWEALALAAATNVTAYHNHLTGLVLLLAPAALLLSAPGGAHGFSPARAVLALLLAWPSVPLLLAPLDYGPQVQAGWLLALGALGLGVLGCRSWAPARGPRLAVWRAPVG